MVGMVGIFLCHLFDDFVQHTSKNIGYDELIQVRFVTWGIVGGEHWYFIVRLPSWSWEYNHCRLEWAMAQRALVYCERWRLVYLFK